MRSRRSRRAGRLQWLAGALLGAVFCSAGLAAPPGLQLPPRPAEAPGGSQIAAAVASLSLEAREAEIVRQILAGNVPAWLRSFCPVSARAVAGGATNHATFFAAPDYLAVGSETDYLLIPLSPGAAQTVADALGCTLPTRKMVNDIYSAAQLKIAPSPIPPSPAMTTVAVFSNHNAIVRAQRDKELPAHPPGTLTAGHKKDVVITPRLAAAPGKVAIYGWHQTNGSPIQPLYLGHTAAWVDYSQCIRLVSQAMAVNGKSTTAVAVLTNEALAPLLSDEGAIAVPRYSTNALSKLEAPKAAAGDSNPPPPRVAVRECSVETNRFDEQVTTMLLDPEVRVQINAPAHAAANTPKLLIFYTLPNGNTIEQTVGRAARPGQDWHFDIQHIGAQTRLLRDMLPGQTIVVAYLEAAKKSWPAWRKAHGNPAIPVILEQVSSAAGLERRPGVTRNMVLTGHSGGGSFIFGYLNTVESIPPEITRIAFLDSNYAYDHALNHHDKLAAWLKRGDSHVLCVLAYDDAVALLDGKPFVSAAGGTWGRSHAMLRDLSGAFEFTCQTNAGFETCKALDGRVQFLLKENPERKILHTVQVERNGFVHAMVCGTTNENQGYSYFGPRAYSRWISED